MFTAQIQPLHRLEKAVLNGVGPQEDIVDAFGLVRNLGYQFVVPSGVAVARGDVSLWGGPVPVSAPRGDEGREVTVFLPNGYAVIPVPRIQYSLLLAARDRPGLMEGGRGVVGLRV